MLYTLDAALGGVSHRQLCSLKGLLYTLFRELSPGPFFVEPRVVEELQRQADRCRFSLQSCWC